jgi:hypothetical protein
VAPREIAAPMNRSQRAFTPLTITADFVLGKTGDRFRWMRAIAQAVAAARLYGEKSSSQATALKRSS